MASHRGVRIRPEQAGVAAGGSGLAAGDTQARGSQEALLGPIVPGSRSGSGARTYRGAGERAVRVHRPMPRQDSECVREADGGECQQCGLGYLGPAVAPSPATAGGGGQPGWVQQPGKR